MQRFDTRSIPALFVLLFFMACPHHLDASPGPSVPMPYKKHISRIISITTQQSETQTMVNVLGDGKVGEYVIERYNTPPKIVVDIICAARSLKGTVVDLNTAVLKRVRVGYHPKKIRLVLDIKGSVIPDFKAESVDNQLTVLVTSNDKKEKKIHFDKVYNREIEKKTTSFKKSGRAAKGEPKHSNEIPEIKDTATKSLHGMTSNTLGKREDDPEQEKKNNVTHCKKIKENDLKTMSPEEKLIQMVKDDGKKDTSSFLKSLDAYRAKAWEDAVEKLLYFIKTYPENRYTEKAYFLLAESYKRLNSQSVSDHFKEIKNYYERATNRFPDSQYIPVAFLGIGDLYFKIKNFSEAMGYYNLVVKKDESSLLSIKALMNKAKILLLRKKGESALKVLDQVEDIAPMYPNIPERTEARLIKTKILYEMNKFHESLDILNALKKTNSENEYEYPEIHLYLGYNYYQLGNNRQARENLYRFLNNHPEQEMNPLILTQIGDTYRNEGSIDDAAKIYRLVVERYPTSDGAIICRIRLAEQQEEGKLKEEIRKEIGSPKKIYEDIATKQLANDEKNPLKQLSLLKLAIAHQKDKAYQKSFTILKELFDKYPGTPLKKELRHTLMTTIEAIQKEEMKNEKFTHVVNFYFKEKKLFLMLDAPELFLSVARAFIHLNLEDMAEALFIKTDTLLSDQGKPPDLLFVTGRYFFEQHKFSNAFKRFDLLTVNYPNDKYASDAYVFKGDIFLKQKKYHQAQEIFSEALKHPVAKCKKVRILIKTAKALTEINAGVEAIQALDNATGLIKDCPIQDGNIYAELGDLYLRHGDANKALKFFNEGIKTVGDKVDEIPIKFKIAGCYRQMKKKKDSISLYNQIVSLNDPFWSNLAKEKMDEIKFKEE